jgi:zinc transporter
MTINSLLEAGVEPGLRFAAVLDGRGGCLDVRWRDIAAWRPEQGLLWVHLERDAPEAARWLHEASGLDPLIAEALLAEESRPRVDVLDDGLLLVMRGVNLAEREDLDLVPLHLWIEPTRVISLRDRLHALTALRDIRVALQAGHGPRTAGGLLVRIAEKIVRDLEPELEKDDVALEALEDEIVSDASVKCRRNLTELRRRVVSFRRYLGPQRDALLNLLTEDTPLLDKRDRTRLRGVIDRVVRHIESLEAIRDRTTILNEDLAAVISERIAKTTHRFTAISAMLLPPSLLAGMLGANIGGIPGHDSPLAFFRLAGILLTLMAAQFIVLRRIKWL